MAAPESDLRALMAHRAFPFADWQSNDLSFLMLERFWAEFFRDIVGPTASEWRQRFPIPRDGNPIITVGHPRTRRAFRVIVTVNEDDLPVYPERSDDGSYYLLTAFMNNADELDGLPPWNELGFFAEMNPAMLDDARFFIRAHCVDGASQEEMERWILDYERRLGLA